MGEGRVKRGIEALLLRGIGSSSAKARASGLPSPPTDAPVGVRSTAARRWRERRSSHVHVRSRVRVSLYSRTCAGLSARPCQAIRRRSEGKMRTQLPGNGLRNLGPKCEGAHSELGFQLGSTSRRWGLVRTETDTRRFRGATGDQRIRLSVVDSHTSGRLWEFPRTRRTAFGAGDQNSGTRQLESKRDEAGVVSPVTLAGTR